MRRSHAVRWMFLASALVFAACADDGDSSDDDDETTDRAAAQPRDKSANSNEDDEDDADDGRADGRADGEASDPDDDADGLHGVLNLDEQAVLEDVAGPIHANVGPIGSDNGQVYGCTGPTGSGVAVICVDRSNPTSGAGTAANPYQLIGTAISASKAGDTIQVAAGTYAENVAIGTYNGTSTKNLKLLGGFQSGTGFTVRNASAQKTIIDGGGSNRPLLVNLGGSGTLVVDGFTLRNGRAPGTNFTNGFGDGGGLFLQVWDAANVTISHNEIRANRTGTLGDAQQFGGGVSSTNRGSGEVRFEDNDIHDNLGAKGAGIGLFGKRTTLLRGRVANNIAYGDHGGGVYVSGPSPVIQQNLISGNEVGAILGYGWGGGIIFDTATNVDMRGNLVTANYARSIGSGVMWDEAATGAMHNDLVYKNLCPGDDRSGAGVYLDGKGDGASAVGTIVTLTNVTVADHVCPGITGGAIFAERKSQVTVESSILWGNTRDFGTDSGGSTKATYSILDASMPGAGNLVQDPLFASSIGNDYHVKSSAGRYASGTWVQDDVTSAAIDGGFGAPGAEVAPHGNRLNMGAFGGTAEASKSKGSETCGATGTPYALATGQSIDLWGTTAGTSDDVTSCFATDGSFDGGELVYALQLSQPGGTLTVSLEDNTGGLDAVLDVRDGSCTTQDWEYCSVYYDDHELLVLEPTTNLVYITVDTLGSASGTYKVHATYEPAACGDGYVNTGEQCDPGGPEAGCSACAYTAPNTTAEACPGMAPTATIPAGTTVVRSADAGLTTYGYADDTTGSCAVEIGGGEQVLRLTPAITGTMTVRIGYEDDGSLVIDGNTFETYGWDVLLYARSSCADPASELACSDVTWGGETISFPVTGGVPVSVFVDGYDGGWYSEGPYDLRVTLTP